jgi:hypothetical protein
VLDDGVVVQPALRLERHVAALARVQSNLVHPG